MFPIIKLWNQELMGSWVKGLFQVQRKDVKNDYLGPLLAAISLQQQQQQKKKTGKEIKIEQVLRFWVI